VRLWGIVPPMVTPLDAEGNVDVPALESEVEHLLAQGVHGLCVTGSTGEGAALGDEEVALVARVVARAVRGRVPVVGGVIRNSTRLAIRCAEGLRAAGVDALQVTPVHYLFAPDADATVAYYRAIGEAVGLPIYVYNVIPWASLAPTVLLRLLREVPAVRGVKQSGGDMHALADLLAAVDDEHTVLTAVDDLLLPSLLLGAHGAIAAILTAAPRPCVELWEAARAGRWEEARRLHTRLLALWRALEGPNLPARVKVALALQGRRGGYPAQPQAAVGPEERARLRQALADLGLVPRGEL
jgi:4-hydroxy-tetrahydrodipicolinate synthase